MKRSPLLCLGLVASLLAPTSRAADDRPHVVFVIGEDEYKTEATLPAFARTLLEPAGVRCTFCIAEPEDPNHFPGLDALKDADLMVLSVRRRSPRAEELKAIRAHLDAGKPLVGIRTASHAFALRNNAEPPEGCATWPEFDPQVLGGHYTNHYPSEVPTFVRANPEARDHPVLAGVPLEEFRSPSTLYKVSPLVEGTRVLMTGRPGDVGPHEPTAWTHTYRGGRVFYTSLGSPGDFEIPAFRRLLFNAVFWGLGRPAPEATPAASR